MATEERNPEMLQYLREHVAYERTMLGYTYARLHDTVPGIAWNVVYGIASASMPAISITSSAMMERTRLSVRTTTSLHGLSATAFLDFNELDVFLFHMSTKRGQHEKLDLRLLQKLGTWLDDEWAKWVSQLPKPYSGILSENAVCSMSLTLTAGVSQATACSAFTATSTTMGVENI